MVVFLALSIMNGLSVQAVRQIGGIPPIKFADFVLIFLIG
jgi:hypothetical protein